MVSDRQTEHDATQSRHEVKTPENGVVATGSFTKAGLVAMIRPTQMTST